jgi:hypothetical protein
MNSAEFFNGMAEFFKSMTGLIIAITGLIGSIVALLKARPVSSKRGASKSPRSRWFKPAIVLFIIFVAVLTARALLPDGKPGSETKTVAAFDAFNEGDYLGAISRATDCIQEFRAAADTKQAALEAQNAPLPPEGSVTDQEKKIILSRGPLNDVASCYWIVGRSAEQLGRIADAREAYREATRYTYARTWDPKGWVWSPGKDAGARLAALERRDPS